jgi:hypothetical protein
MPPAAIQKRRGLKAFFLPKQNVKEGAVAGLFMVSKMFKKLLIFWKVKEI